jgi:phosphoribosylformylglycinamidine synthase subunit PurL
VFSSAHDIAEGGLAVALAEACLSRPEGAIGARVTLNGNLRPDVLLFGESQSRVVVSLSSSSLPLLQTLAQTANVSYTVLGTVGGSDLVIADYLQLSVTQLCHQWRTALAQQLIGVDTNNDQ